MRYALTALAFFASLLVIGVAVTARNRAPVLAHILRLGDERRREEAEGEGDKGYDSAYRITSSAWKRRIGGIVRPRVWEVLRLITSSNFVGCSTGRSPGLAPFRILSTKVAARRTRSGKFG